MTLEGMTQDKWVKLAPVERARLRSESGLTRQLIGLEGQKVEVVTTEGKMRRFIVGRSTGWVPCHIEKKRANSTGGVAAEKEYRSVRCLSLLKAEPPYL